jgi:hypothetical protein
MDPPFSLYVAIERAYFGLEVPEYMQRQGALVLSFGS